MKILQKLLLVLIIASCVMVIMPKNYVNASSVGDLAGDVKPDMADNSITQNLGSVVSKILGFIQVASGLLSVVMIAWTGFRYIIETPEMKNELKKSLIPIVVGFLLVFMASTIARFVIKMFENNG